MQSHGGPRHTSAKTHAPLDVLRNCKGKVVAVELRNNETVNGIVMRTDRTMNIIIKQCIRTSSDGERFYKARECFIRGSSIRTVRMEEDALRVAPPPPRGGGRPRKVAELKEKLTRPKGKNGDGKRPREN